MRAAAAGDAQIRPAAVLCASALESVRSNIDLLVAEADEVLQGVRDSMGTIRRLAESNEAFAAELAEEGTPSLAAAKCTLERLASRPALQRARPLPKLDFGTGLVRERPREETLLALSIAGLPAMSSDFP